MAPLPPRQPQQQVLQRSSSASTGTTTSGPTSTSSQQQHQQQQGRDRERDEKKDIKYNLWVHDDRFSKRDLVLNPDVFKNVKVGDLVEIFHPGGAPAAAAASGGSGGGGAGDATLNKRKDAVILQVENMEDSLGGGKTSLQISIAQHVAALFNLHARKDVIVRKVDKESLAADYIELAFRDQYIGRGDMWKFKNKLMGTCLYRGKKIGADTGNGAGTGGFFRAVVRSVAVAGKETSCGYIVPATRVIFRSETAKYFIFIQMSKEMWDFDEDGELYFEKCVHGFLPELFSKWKTTGVNHVVSVVLFSRIYYTNEKDDSDDRGTPDTITPKVVGDDEIPILTDFRGRRYRDFYKVIADWETRADWFTLLPTLKRSFLSFLPSILQQPNPSNSGSTILSGTNSSASEGNILEAINLGLIPFDRHYIDRDLLRTGLSIIVVSPGTGVFEVGRALLRLTERRMVEVGVGADLVCLSKRPLSVVPLFGFRGGGSGGGVGSHTRGGVSGGTASPTSWTIREREQSGASTITSEDPGRWRDRAVSVNMPPNSGSTTGGGVMDRRYEIWDPLYSDDPVEGSSDAQYGESEGELFYTVPSWVMPSYWCREESRGGCETGGGGGFVPRCKMYEVQMMGVMEMIGEKVVMPYMEDAFPGEGMSVGDTSTAVPHPDNKEASNGRLEQRGNTQVKESGVRFKIGGDDEEESPVGHHPNSSSTEGKLVLHSRDMDRYDDLVFMPQTLPVSMRVPLSTRTRSNSAVGPLSEYVVDSQNMYPQGKPTRTGSRMSVNVRGDDMRGASVSPDFVMMNLNLRRTNTSMSVVDAMGGRSEGVGYAYSSGYPEWDCDSLSGEDRVAVMKARARIEYFRNMNSATTSAYGGAASLALANLFMEKGAGAAGGGGTGAGGSGRSQYQLRHSQQPPLPNPLSAVPSFDTTDSVSDMERLNEGSHISNVTTTGASGLTGSTDTYTDDTFGRISSTSSLGPIHIRRTNPSYGLTTGSGSYKGPSPLREFELLKYTKPSPGKTGTGRYGSGTGISGSGGGGGGGGGAPMVIRPNIINPFNPARNTYYKTPHNVRWRHVFTNPSPSSGMPVGNPHLTAAMNTNILGSVAMVEWKSLCTPACLPLTTDYFPSEQELGEEYQEYTYTVSLADTGAGGDLKAGVESLLVALVGQRLMQGFQLVRETTTERDVGVAVSGPRLGKEKGNKRLIGGFDTRREVGSSRAGSVSSVGVPSPATQRKLGGLLVAEPSSMSITEKDEREEFTDILTSTPYYLSLGDHVHKLFYDSSGHNVEIKRYVRKTTHSTAPIPYSFGVWPKLNPSQSAVPHYIPKTLSFAYPPVGAYNWNYLDHLMSGYQDDVGEMTENLKFWRARFLVVPGEKVTEGVRNWVLGDRERERHAELDDEEVRLVGFERFLECVERMRWTGEDEMAGDVPSGGNGGGVGRGGKTGKRKLGGRKLEVTMTTLTPAKYIKEEFLKSVASGDSDTAALHPATSAPSASAAAAAVAATARRGSVTSPMHALSSITLTRSTPLDVIMSTLQSPPPHGVPICDRRWHFRLYPQVFIGSDCVDWILRMFSDVETREEALEVGRNWMGEGAVEHVSGRHGFLDGYYFYKVGKTYRVRHSKSREREKEKGKVGKDKEKEKEKEKGGLLHGHHQHHHHQNQPDAKVERTHSAPARLHKPLEPSSSSLLQHTGSSASSSSGNGHGGHAGHGGTTVASSSSTSPPEPFPLTKRTTLSLSHSPHLPRQTAILHYDTLHNPLTCWKFRLEWLVCSPRLVEEMISAWGRVAEKCGFRMVEAGTEENDWMGGKRPFEGGVWIHCAVGPWESGGADNEGHGVAEDESRARSNDEGGGVTNDDDGSRGVAHDNDEGRAGGGEESGSLRGMGHAFGSSTSSVASDPSMLAAGASSPLSTHTPASPVLTSTSLPTTASLSLATHPFTTTDGHHGNPMHHLTDHQHPPTVESLEPFYRALLTKFNFVLDTEADSAFPKGSVAWSYDKRWGEWKREQWVWRNGAALVQVVIRDPTHGQAHSANTNVNVNVNTSTSVGSNKSVTHLDLDEHQDTPPVSAFGGTTPDSLDAIHSPSSLPHITTHDSKQTHDSHPTTDADTLKSTHSLSSPPPPITQDCPFAFYYTPNRLHLTSLTSKTFTTASMTATAVMSEEAALRRDIKHFCGDYLALSGFWRGVRKDLRKKAEIVSSSVSVRESVSVVREGDVVLRPVVVDLYEGGAGKREFRAGVTVEKDS
ncbi:vacuolar membrane-associated protein iml1 [Gaertneriomyces sp. JEL0708]|nr:vacuolar membrane-associated protein iml1 [Gaertneriomyces sp. JEL0708]